MVIPLVEYLIAGAASSEDDDVAAAPIKPPNVVIDLSKLTFKNFLIL